MAQTFLTESGWKALLAKPKAKGKVKDNGLQRALSIYEKLPEDKHADRLKALAPVLQLATALRRVRDIAALEEVCDYLDQVCADAQTEQRQITQAKAAAEKAAMLAAKSEAMTLKKADAEAKKREQEEQKSAQGQAVVPEEEEEEDQTGDSIVKLRKALQNLKVSKEPYYFLACDAKPYGLIVSRKNIKSSSQHKKELATLAGGSTRPPKFGTCRREGNVLIFDMEKPAPGLARILQKWIKTSAGLGLKVVVGDEAADDEEAPEDMKNPNAGPEPADPRGPAAEEEPKLNMTAPFAISGSVGRGGKNHPDDVQAVQTALNRRAKAGLDVDGKCGSDTIKAIEAFQKALGQFKPDGRVDPGRGTARALAGSAKIGPPPAAPKPIAPPKLGKGSLAKAPEIWHQTRRILDRNIDELKKGVRAHYGAEHPELVALVEQNIVKMNGVLDKLDARLAHSLEKANAAKDETTRKAELQMSRSILMEYIKYVKSEALIGHIDSNPFGVDTKLRKVITDSLTNMAQSIG